MGFAFAHHFASHDAVDAMTNYHNRFTPSGWRADAARHSGGGGGIGRNRRGSRQAGVIDGPQPAAPRPRPVSAAAIVEEALAYPYTDSERASIARNRSRLFVGSPATVMQKLQPMIAASKADELMIITAVYDHDARKKSYSLLADAFGLGKKAAA